jgi:hypothetical protein
MMDTPSINNNHTSFGIDFSTTGGHTVTDGGGVIPAVVRNIGAAFHRAAGALVRAVAFVGEEAVVRLAADKRVAL